MPTTLPSRLDGWIARTYIHIYMDDGSLEQDVVSRVIPESSRTHTQTNTFSTTTRTDGEFNRAVWAKKKSHTTPVTSRRRIQTGYIAFICNNIPNTNHTAIPRPHPVSVANKKNNRTRQHAERPVISLPSRKWYTINSTPLPKASFARSLAEKPRCLTN